MSSPGVVEVPTRSGLGIGWRAIIGGAVIAAGISLTLLAFGSAIGLSVASTAPTWRDSSPVLWFLSGLYLVFVSLAAFGFGGYVAGRMHQPEFSGAPDEAEFGDGIHGIVTWALAVMFASLLAVAAAAIASSTAVPSTGNLGPTTSVAGESIIASELDELFRSERRDVDTGIQYRRAEAARILLKASSHNGMPAADRDYLTGVTAEQTGIGDVAASQRVDNVIANSAQEIHRARQALVIQAFLIGAALILGAAVAWYAACEGGRDRRENVQPLWDWRFTRSRRAHSDLART